MIAAVKFKAHSSPIKSYLKRELASAIFFKDSSCSQLTEGKNYNVEHVVQHWCISSLPYLNDVM